MQNFSLLFISLLTALIFENSHIVAGVYFIFLKKHPRPNLKSFQHQIWTSVKRLGNSYQVRHILAIFCKFIALILC